MELITTVFYFLVVIGILVFIHEFGHFAAARINGMRADVFAFGMGPRILGLNRKTGFSFGKLSEEIDLEGKTDYRICAFPIGGFVKIAGMIDESMDKDFLKSEPQPWEYRSKPVWRRMIVITAGVIMNLILAFVIFYSVTLLKGKEVPDTTTIGYVAPGTTASDFGFHEGDKIVSINDKPVTDWENILSKIHIDFLGEPQTFVVNRAEKLVTITIPKEKTLGFVEKPIGFTADNVNALISDVLPGKPADVAGFKPMDIVLSVNGEKIKNSARLIDLIKSNPGKEISIEYLRKEVVSFIKVTPSVADSTIGIAIGEKYTGPEKLISYNVFSAIPETFRQMYYYGIEIFFKSIAKVIKGDIPFKKAFGGPIKIARASAQSAEGGFLSFIRFVALLSISLAVINILPFPALDGGHFVILCWEGIFRKPLSHKIQIGLQYAGFIILIAFMLIILYNDIISLK